MKWCFSNQLKYSVCKLGTKTNNKELFYLEAQMLYSRLKLNHLAASKKHTHRARTILLRAKHC